MCACWRVGALRRVVVTIWGGTLIPAVALVYKPIYLNYVSLYSSVGYAIVHCVKFVSVHHIHDDRKIQPFISISFYFVCTKPQTIYLNRYIVHIHLFNFSKIKSNALHFMCRKNTIKIL